MIILTSLPGREVNCILKIFQIFQIQIIHRLLTGITAELGNVPPQSQHLGSADRDWQVNYKLDVNMDYMGPCLKTSKTTLHHKQHDEIPEGLMCSSAPVQCIQTVYTTHH